MMTNTGWISLSFDDALDQHLDTAIPVMNDCGIKGTFYVHLSARGFLRRTDDWRAAAEAGHELGNHTVFHPAIASKEWVRPGNAIDHYTLDRMRLELEFANDWLTVIDGQSQRTFAYPCSNSCIGHLGRTHRLLEVLGLNRTRLATWVDRWHLDLGATRQSYEGVVGDLFVAGRGGGLAPGDVVPPVTQWSRTRLLSVAVEDWTLADLQKHLADTIERGTWAILQFHGIGGGHHMDCSPSVFRDFVVWLQNKHAERVITVLEGAQRLWPKGQPAMPPAVTSGAVS